MSSQVSVRSSLRQVGPHPRYYALDDGDDERGVDGCMVERLEQFVCKKSGVVLLLAGE